MKRRNFLKGSLCASVALSFSSGFGFSNAWAAVGARQRSVVNTMLLGGADLRHLFVPPPSPLGADPKTNYEKNFWDGRIDLYNPPGVPARDAQTVWNQDYTPVTHRGKTFGIHNSAKWLIDQFVLGHVAIVCNVKPATNQRHDHATLIMNTGDRNTQNFKVDVPGWGGKLAYAITQSTANVVSLTNSVSVFCNGMNSANRNERVISAPNMRDIALSERAGTGVDGKLSRSLMAYYARRGVDLEPTPYAKITHHEKALRIQGAAIDSGLLGTAWPPEINNLYQSYFGRQARSLYDTTILGTGGGGAFNSSILNMRVASMEVYGWDTHDYQNKLLTNLFAEMFGVGRVFDTLTSKISADASDNMVFTITSEFGRQLGGNGTWGTDHGVGTYMIVIGKQVRGDVYGEMFPKAEIPLWVNHHNYITGLTAFERVLGEVCDWVEPGTADTVFGATNVLEREPNVDLRAMFSPVYKVSGTIRNGAGIPIPSVNVIIMDSTGVDWNIISDANGFYSFDPLIPGTYSMAFSKSQWDIPSSGFSIASADVIVNATATPLFPDADKDTIPDATDNCTNVINQNQRDTNKDGFGNMCDADLNNDKRVDLKDKDIMKKAFTTYNPDADLNGDGVVNSKDWDILLKLYGKAPGPSGIAR